MKISAQVAFCIASLSLCGFADIDYSTWFQQVVNNVNVYSSNCWVDPADATATKVSASAGNLYYVPVGMTAYTPEVNSTFPGASLAVAGTLSLRKYAKTHTINDLRLLAGSTLNSGGTYNYLAGNVDIGGTEAAPVKMWMFYYGMKNHFEYSANFTGGRDSVVRMGSSSTTVSRDQMLACYLGITGNWANYFGKLIIGTNVCVKLSSGSNQFPGEVFIENKGMLSFNNYSIPQNVTIGSLTLSDGAMVYTLFNGSHWTLLTVTNSFSVVGSPTFIITNRNLDLDNSITLLRLGDAAAANAPDVSGLGFEIVEYNFDLREKMHADLKDNGDGTKDMRFVWPGLVQMVTSNGSYQPEKSAFNATNTSYWSTGVIPDSSFTGDVYCSDRNLQWREWLHFSYPGMTLYTLGNIFAHVHSLDLKAINILGNMGIYSYAGPTTTELKAPLVLNGHKVVIGGRNGRTVVLSGEISGSGKLDIRWDGAPERPFGVDIKGTNTNFSGSVYVFSHDGSYDSEGADQAIRLEFHDARNLGGVYSDADSWKAFQVAGYSYVKCSGDITLSEPTRGLFVDRGARFYVPTGKTLEIDYQMTYGGEFMKLGPGDVVLGCAAPGFATNGVPAELPLAGTNVLTIAEGALRVAATNAVNGLAVKFADGTGLVVDPCPSDADLQTYGAINTRWSVPFTGAAAGEAIPVTFLERTFPEKAFSAAICTVSAAAAETIAFDVPSRVQKRKCRVATRPNPDGSVTFVAGFSARSGLIVNFQ